MLFNLYAPDSMVLAIKDWKTGQYLQIMFEKPQKLQETRSYSITQAMKSHICHIRIWFPNWICFGNNETKSSFNFFFFSIRVYIYIYMCVYILGTKIHIRECNFLIKNWLNIKSKKKGVIKYINYKLNMLNANTHKSETSYLDIFK